MPTPLTKREARISRAFQRYERLKEKAEAAYARADRAAHEISRKIFKQGKKLSAFTSAVRISDEGKYLLATDQYLEARHETEQGTGDGKIWAHAAARQFKLATKNLD